MNSTQGITGIQKYTFASESVAPGHPDKICDQISDVLLDTCLAREPEARCAFETFATLNTVIIGGEGRYAKEILTNSVVEDKIRNLLKSINCIHKGFHWNEVKIQNFIHEQSKDIAIGVDSINQEKDEGAGDQGIMFGYACIETPELMPAAIFYSHKILKNLCNKKIEGLFNDAKSQVSLKYVNSVPVGVDSITVSIQHSPEMTLQQVRELVIPVIESSIPTDWMPEDEKIFINPTGIFVIGGPTSDTGLTGRKIIVDTYGGASPHGGGAFSGKDPTKVDRSATYMARHIAKSVVASKVATRCTVQLSYIIGVTDPISIYINTHNTSKASDIDIKNYIAKNFPLSPRGIREYLDLNRPIYLPTATFGHFGRTVGEGNSFTWEKVASINL